MFQCVPSLEVSADSFGLSNIASLLGYGGDEEEDEELVLGPSPGDNASVQVLEDLINTQINLNNATKKENKIPSTEDVAVKLIERLNINQTDKKQLWNLFKTPKKTKLRKPFQIKGIKNGPVSKFIKSLILDCVKDIIKTINEEETPSPPVDKDTVKESREQVEKLKDEFNKKIEETYKPLLAALDKANPKNLTEEKARVNEIIEDAKKKIESLVEYYNGTSKTFEDQLKTQKEIINDNIKNFTDSVVASNCVSVRKSKTAFQECLEPLYCDFNGNLTQSIDKVEKLKDVLNVLGKETVDYVSKEAEKELKDAEDRVKKEIEKLTKPNTDTDAEYLKKQSENALKQIDDILINNNNSINNLNILKETAKQTIESVTGDVNKTQIPERDALNKYYNDPAPGNAEVDKYVAEKNGVINKAGDTVVEDISNRGELLSNINTGINTIVAQYTSDKVNALCKGNAAFEACVDAQYKEFNDKLQPLLEQIKQLNENPIENVVTDLKGKITSVLDEATEKANIRAQEIKEEAERKEKYVQDTKTKSDVKVSEVDPLVKTTTTIVGELTASYDNVTANVRDKLTAIVLNNADDSETLSPEDKQYIDDKVQAIVDQINTYKEQLKEEENKAKILENDLKTTANLVTEQTLKQQCKPDWDVENSFKSCIDTNIAPLNEQADKVFSDVTQINDNLKANKVNTDLELNERIEEILKKADEKFTAERLARDENNQTTSTERINECLETINKRVNDELSPLIESLFAVPKDLQDQSNIEVAEAVKSINKAYQTWLDALDLSSVLNSKLNATYNTQKLSIAVLIQNSIDKLGSTVKLNLDSFTTLELKVQSLQDSLYKKVAGFTADSLNKTCASVYSSKRNYSKCIEEACSGFRSNINETAKQIIDAGNDIKSLFDSAKDIVTKTIEDEQKKALEQSKLEAMKLFNSNNVTIESVEKMALGDLGRFNITPYILYINDINNKAVELDKRTTAMNQTGNNMLTRASLQLNLHTYAASQICPRVSIKNETSMAESLISESRNKVYPVFPDTSAYIEVQRALALQLNETLKAQINQLSPDNIEKRCGAVKDSLYDYFACVKVAVKEFENYFVPANKDVRVLSQNSANGLQNQTVLLNTWRDVDVTNELSRLAGTLGPIPEIIYNGACNATKDKVLDFAQLTVNNRWNRFSKTIPEAERNVTAIAKEILAKPYTGVVNVEGKLNNSVDFIRVALEAAQRKNASYVTPARRDEPDRTIGVGIKKYNDFIDEIYRNASNAINESTALRVQSENLYNNINKSVIEKACYNPNVASPTTQFVLCNNGFSYNFEVELQKLQTKLDETKKQLQNINNTSGKKVLEEYANKLAQDLLLYSAQYSINIYNDNGLPIPDNLKPYVKSNCVVATGAGKNPGCIIEF